MHFYRKNYNSVCALLKLDLSWLLFEHICAKGNRLWLTSRHLIPQLSVPSMLAKYTASHFPFHFPLVTEQGVEWSYNLVSQEFKSNPYSFIALRL